MFVSQIVSDAAVTPSRRSGGPFGPQHEQDRGSGLRARVADGWHRLTSDSTAPKPVACADCAA